MIAASAAGISYAFVYMSEYYKNKKSQKDLDNMCAYIRDKLNSENDSTKAYYAMKILEINTDWECDKISNEDISNELSPYRKQALKIIKSIANQGNAMMQYNLAQMYYFSSDYYIESDTVKAVYWWNEAAKNGYPQAFFPLAISYESGLGGLKVDTCKAIELLKLGAEHGDSSSEWYYGLKFRDGVSVYNGKRAIAIKTVDTYYGSKNNIIKEYNDKDGNWVTIYRDSTPSYKVLVPKDIEKAKFWWRKAALQGNINAKDDLERVYN